ncbi:hypothetical protein [Streptomyces sp. 11x1]|uniref:hypothetical protein n=1 Tax=Streptomyces sp. 11x1 TaxID=3038642 RepID=UPI00292D8E1E|nr:hypothetical protein [Streptomyces sp. 11x1]WNZ14227.1 hypothetical protein P8T65_46185 [Streptomyces sp. 11x1]
MAPSSAAGFSREASRSTAMIVVAPLLRAAMTAAAGPPSRSSGTPGGTFTRLSARARECVANDD